MSFTLDAAAGSWTVRGPGLLPRRMVSPLADERFRALVSSLREWASRPVPRGRPDPLRTAVFVEDRARRVSARLTQALLSDEERRALGRALASGGKVRITIRARSDDDHTCDAALALPWELLAPESPGRFPVCDGRLVVIREALAGDASNLRNPSWSRAPLATSACRLAGFAHVVACFGPAHAELNARLEERFYSVLATGGTLLEAVAAARAALNEPVGDKGARENFPFAWTQLAIYFRG